MNNKFSISATKFDCRSVSLRVVVSVLSLGLVILSSTFSGNLIASLTVQDIQLPFKTLEVRVTIIVIAVQSFWVLDIKSVA